MAYVVLLGVSVYNYGRAILAEHMHTQLIL